MTVAPKLPHTVLQTNRLAAMRDFYCTMLGAHAVHDDAAITRMHLGQAKENR